MNQVIYCSKTRKGNTRRLAAAVAGAIGAMPQDISEAGEVHGVDTLFIGSSIYAGRINSKLREYLAGIGAGEVKQAVVFGSAAGEKSARDEIAEILAANGIDVSEKYFLCKGSFLLSNKGRPNADDLANAEAFAQEMA
jgi:flavorubredoxin